MSWVPFSKLYTPFLYDGSGCQTLVIDQKEFLWTQLGATAAAAWIRWYNHLYLICSRSGDTRHVCCVTHTVHNNFGWKKRGVEGEFSGGGGSKAKAQSQCTTITNYKKKFFTGDGRTHVESSTHCKPRREKWGYRVFLRVNAFLLDKKKEKTIRYRLGNGR